MKDKIGLIIKLKNHQRQHLSEYCLSHLLFWCIRAEKDWKTNLKFWYYVLLHSTTVQSSYTAYTYCTEFIYCLYIYCTEFIYCLYITPIRVISFVIVKRAQLEAIKKIILFYWFVQQIASNKYMSLRVDNKVLNEQLWYKFCISRCRKVHQLVVNKPCFLCNMNRFLSNTLSIGLIFQKQKDNQFLAITKNIHHILILQLTACQTQAYSDIRSQKKKRKKEKKKNVLIHRWIYLHR